MMPKAYTNARSNSLLEAVIAAVFGTLAVWRIIPEIRHQFRMWRSQSWPVVHGTVQKGEVLHSGGGRASFLPFRSLLGYAFSVDGRSYWGVFVLAAEDMQTAEKLQKQAEGIAATVQYDPKNPEISFLVDRELLGRRIVQDPRWLDS
jgi:hypothetical protein